MFGEGICQQDTRHTDVSAPMFEGKAGPFLLAQTHRVSRHAHTSITIYRATVSRYRHVCRRLHHRSASPPYHNREGSSLRRPGSPKSPPIRNAVRVVILNQKGRRFSVSPFLVAEEPIPGRLGVGTRRLRLWQRLACKMSVQRENNITRHV